MSDRQAQIREAQRRRRERLKESGVKAITLELSEAAHARLRELSTAMFGESRPSAVIEHLLTTSALAPEAAPAEAVHEPELTTSTERPMSATMAAILRNQTMQAEWQKWPGVMGIDPAAWYRAKSNADRTAMAKKAFRPLASKEHPDKGGDIEAMRTYQVVYDAIRTGKKSPDMPARWAGWGSLA
jgi:hypothetical protein